MGDQQPRRPFFLRRNIRNKANPLDESVSPVTTIGPNGMMALEAPLTTTGKEESSAALATAKEDISSGGAIISTAATTTTTTTRSDYQIVDNTEVKLNMNSYKMVWMTNKHGLFYKRNSISKARKVSFEWLAIAKYI